MALVIVARFPLLHPDQGQEALDGERLALCEDDVQPDVENDAIGDSVGVVPIQIAEAGV